MIRTFSFIFFSMTGQQYAFIWYASANVINVPLISVCPVTAAPVCLLLNNHTSLLPCCLRFNSFHFFHFVYGCLFMCNLLELLFVFFTAMKATDSCLKTMCGQIYGWQWRWKVVSSHDIKRTDMPEWKTTMEPSRIFTNPVTRAFVVPLCFLKTFNVQ